MIGPEHALVKLRARDEAQDVLCSLAREVLDDAEAERGSIHAVQPHDDAPDLASFGEDLKDLFLVRLKRYFPPYSAVDRRS